MRKPKKEGLSLCDNPQNTELLRFLLIAYISDIGATPCSIKKGHTKNPFPIGTRAVYTFAKQGIITDSHKWKLLEFFKLKLIPTKVCEKLHTK